MNKNNSLQALSDITSIRPICSMQVRSPSTSPTLVDAGHARALPNTVPTATKAPPPVKPNVNAVARPSNAPIKPPMVARAASPIRAVPAKRPAEAHENTARKMKRLMQATPPKPSAAKPQSKPPQEPPTQRSLETELDQVSESRGSPLPESSLVFPPGTEKQTSPPCATFTPTPSVLSDPGDGEASMQVELCGVFS